MRMSEYQFKQQILGEFPAHSPELRMAMGLWVCYHIKCERFDLEWCHGHSIPRNEGERSGSNRHARAVTKRMHELAEQYNITPEVLKAGRKAIAQCTRLELGKLEELLLVNGWDKSIMPLMRGGAVDGRSEEVRGEIHRDRERRWPEG